jgi:hypothetical protein
MPRVPQYQEGQVAARAAPQVQQQHISTNAPNMAEGFGNGLNRLAQVVDQQQQHADELRVEDTFNQLREQQLDLQLGQQNGYVNIKGKNALPVEGESLAARYESQFKGSADKLAETLANPRQKELFKKYADRAGLEFKSGLMRHENAEIEGWRKQVVEGAIAVESDNAAKNFNNPEAIQLSRARIDINLGRMRDSEGVPANQFDAIRMKALSKFHGGVIQAAVDGGDVGRAKAYFDQYKDEISVDVQTGAKKLLDTGEFEARTQTAADALFAEHKGDAAAALAAAREKHTGKDEDAIVTRIKTLDSERVALRERAQKDVADQAWKLYASGGMGKIPPSLLAQMDGRELTQLRSTARQEAENAARRAKGEKVDTDWEAYYTLRADPAVLKEANLIALKPKLGETEFKELVRAQEDLRTGKPGVEHNIRTTSAVVEEMLGGSGITKKKDPKEYGAFYAQLEASKRSMEAATGKPLTQDEVRKEAARLLTKVRLPGALWGTNEKPLFEVPADKLGSVVVPKEERAQIEAALSKRKIPVTDQTVQSLYLQSLKATNGR